jgi:glycerol kinase
VIASAVDLDPLAASADPAESVYLVPAFVGLGAPWWDAEARGAIFGLSRKSGPAELARAVIESVGYQTFDLLTAMQSDWSAGGASTVLRVDGGMSASDATLQFLADILDSPVDRPVIMETTALGAAYLAGFAAGIYPDTETFARTWKLSRRFLPAMAADLRTRKYAAWKNAVRRTLST